jgi:tetratricopeptide (TPR) repeat protein
MIASSPNDHGHRRLKDCALNSSTESSNTESPLAGKRVLLLGSLGGLNKRQSQEVLRKAGAKVLEHPTPPIQTIVIGHDHLGLDSLLKSEPDLRTGIESGAITSLDEQQLWPLLDNSEQECATGQLYTPAMLAELLKVPVRIVRRWCSAGLLRPVKEVFHLPFFDYSELATARQLVKWGNEGATVQSIQKQLTALSELSPASDRSLLQLEITSEGKHLLLRQGQSLLESTGQFRFTFDDETASEESGHTISIAARATPKATNSSTAPVSLEQMIEQAMLAEDEDEFETAIDWYRSALAAFGPNADVNFQLAELLYRTGDSSAARERYYMALELDGGLVEARANLGCVLAEMGQLELAIAAFEGTLQQFEAYADVHFHLARALDDLGQDNRATAHWRRFIELAPASPWAEEAQLRLSHLHPTLEF